MRYPRSQGGVTGSIPVASTNKSESYLKGLVEGTQTAKSIADRRLAQSWHREPSSNGDYQKTWRQMARPSQTEKL